jgi:predicted glycosyltransferase
MPAGPGRLTGLWPALRVLPVTAPSRRIWIDVTNSPHVLFFRPILRRLDDAGVPWTLTARDFAQTLGLLHRFGIAHTVIGRHGGASLRGKGLGLVRRSGSLVRFGRGRGFTQAVSHGSNDLAIAARLLRIHSTVLHDFEGATGMHKVNFRLADKVMLPEVIPFEALAPLGLDRGRHRPYPGLKEQVALADFEPDPGVLEELGLDREQLIVVMRPPATMSLYHRGLHNTVFEAVLTRVLDEGAQVVLLPRTPEQAASFAGIGGLVIPAAPVDGPSLVWSADAVISAGGTMNREAAVLGVPTWTTFAGELGAVDRQLIAEGRMRVLERPEDVVITKRRPAALQVDAIADAVTEEILRR